MNIYSWSSYLLVLGRTVVEGCNRTAAMIALIQTEIWLPLAVKGSCHAISVIIKGRFRCKWLIGISAQHLHSAHSYFRGCCGYIRRVICLRVTEHLDAWVHSV